MKLSRIILRLLVLAAVSFAILPATLARFSEEYSGSDTMLIAKWNFSARGEDDEEYFNKGFTFDLFNASAVEPMDRGEKSFSLRSGSSDVDVEYNVEMNANELIKLTTDDNQAVIATYSGKDVYAPLIFKVTATMNAGAQDSSPPVFQTDWFRLQDQEPDEQGYFSILDLADGKPSFSPGSPDEVTVTVRWQWNTSYFINDTGVATVTPNTVMGGGIYPEYYQLAYDQYYGSGGLQEQREAAVNAIDAYLNAHGSPEPGGAWPPESKECTEDHFANYNAFVAAANAAADACNTSLLAAYDDYDTFAARALNAKPSVQVIFRISGDQIRPN